MVRLWKDALDARDGMPAAGAAMEVLGTTLKGCRNLAALAEGAAHTTLSMCCLSTVDAILCSGHRYGSVYKALRRRRPEELLQSPKLTPIDRSAGTMRCGPLPKTHSTGSRSLIYLRARPSHPGRFT